MHHPHRLVRAVLAPLRHRRAAHIVVKHQYFCRTGDCLHQPLHLRIVDGLHLLHVVEIRHPGLVARQHEALLIQRQLRQDGPAIANGQRVWGVSPRPSWGA